MTEEAPTQAPAMCGVLDGYRSPLIGKLVSARSKASEEIKAIIKDKTANVPSKTGAGYKYAYADLASVLDAVEGAISKQGLAIFQTTQDRGKGTFLVTTLAHESDQWMASEIRLKSADQGPQVFGSELTYLRRYAVLSALALAPEADDDGKAAQERADQRPQQQARPAVPVQTQPPKMKHVANTWTSEAIRGELSRCRTRGDIATLMKDLKEALDDLPDGSAIRETASSLYASMGARNEPEATKVPEGV